MVWIHNSSSLGVCNISLPAWVPSPQDFSHHQEPPAGAWKFAELASLKEMLVGAAAAGAYEPDPMIPFALEPDETIYRNFVDKYFGHTWKWVVDAYGNQDQLIFQIRNGTKPIQRPIRRSTVPTALENITNITG